MYIFSIIQQIIHIHKMISVCAGILQEKCKKIAEWIVPLRKVCIIGYINGYG